MYTVLVTIFATTFPRELLLTRPLLGPESAWPWSWAALPGVYIIGVGASLQCLLIGSNVLHSLAANRVLPDSLMWLQIHRQTDENPRLAKLYTVLLTLGLLFIVDLEILAQLATMSFLLCYCFSNISCCLLSVFRSPSWRPRFRHFHWISSLLGAILCMSLMFVIHSYFALISILVCGYTGLCKF